MSDLQVLAARIREALSDVEVESREVDARAALAELVQVAERAEPLAYALGIAQGERDAAVADHLAEMDRGVVLVRELDGLRDALREAREALQTIYDALEIQTCAAAGETPA